MLSLTFTIFCAYIVLEVVCALLIEIFDIGK